MTMTGSEQRAPGAPSEDAKARFRQALEAKKAAAHPTADGGSVGGSVRGSETAGPGKRQFRRKSGSA
jgi:hypothetical protein